MGKRFWLTVPLLFVTVAVLGLFLVPNPLGGSVLAAAKAHGYLAYTLEEATTLAYERCTKCHGAERMLQYCSRCGPPFVVVAQAMKKYVELSNLDGDTVKPFSDAELTAIVQVWNALVGNWEGEWRQQDIKRMLGGDRSLIRLLETAPDERPIEMALRDKTAPGSYKEIQSFGRITP
jgi:hypothetical protein